MFVCVLFTPDCKPFNAAAWWSNPWNEEERTSHRYQYQIR